MLDQFWQKIKTTASYSKSCFEIFVFLAMILSVLHYFFSSESATFVKVAEDVKKEFGDPNMVICSSYDFAKRIKVGTILKGNSVQENAEYVHADLTIGDLVPDPDLKINTTKGKYSYFKQTRNKMANGWLQIVDLLAFRCSYNTTLFIKHLEHSSESMDLHSLGNYLEQRKLVLEKLRKSILKVAGSRPSADEDRKHLVVVSKVLFARNITVSYETNPATNFIAEWLQYLFGLYGNEKDSQYERQDSIAQCYEVKKLFVNNHTGDKEGDCFLSISQEDDSMLIAVDASGVRFDEESIKRDTGTYSWTAEVVVLSLVLTGVVLILIVVTVILYYIICHLPKDPQATGLQAADPVSTGPEAAGIKPTGPQATDPQTAGTQATSTQSTVPQSTPASNEADSDISDVEDEGYLDFNNTDNVHITLDLKPCTKQSVTSLYLNSDKVYHMADGVRGRVLILNNLLFRDNPGIRRSAADVDYVNVRRLFEEMNFEIAKTEADLTDLTAEEMLEEIQEETTLEVHNSYSMFVIVICSHGESADRILCHDNKYVDLSTITKLLSAFKFPAMKGKPKLVIVQASSGGGRDYGDSIHSNPTRVTSATGTIVSDVAVDDEATDVKQSASCDVTLDSSDFFIMKASTESYVALRSPTHGSHFIRILVATFYRHSCHRDLESLFKIIQERVRRSTTTKRNPDESWHGGVMPESRCTFTNYRKLYFFPNFPPRKGPE